MREEDSSWFSKWQDELPAPEELTPLSQTLITPDLALAFDIRGHGNYGSSQQFHRRRSSQTPATPPAGVPGQMPSSVDFDSSSAEEPARTLKRPRLVWTPQLHKRFVDAVAHLGIKNAVPKTIMQLMSVDGLTRENVASHLQKYRLYLKRMQGIGNGAGAGAGGGSGDAATDHLFASSPVPPHLLGRANSEHFMGYVSPAAMQHQHHVAAMVAGGQYQHHLQNRQLGHFGSGVGGGGGQFDHSFLARQAPVGGRLGGGAVVQNSGHGYVEELDLGPPANGKKALTLFPASED